MWISHFFNTVKSSARRLCFQIIVKCILVISLIFFIIGCVEDVCFEEPGWEKWERIDFPVLKREDGDFTSVAECPDGNLIIGSEGFVFKQVEGNNWEKYIVTDRKEDITRIVNDGNGLLFAAQRPGGVFVSDDNGKSWRQVNSHLENIFVNDLAVTPGGKLFAGTDEGGIFVTTDKGKTWQYCGDKDIEYDVTSLAVASDSVLYFGTAYGGVFRSKDNGQTWSDISGGMKYRTAMDLAVCLDGSVLVASFGGIYKCNNTSDTLTYVGPSLERGRIGSIVIAPDGVVYASELRGGMWISRDGCSTWENSNYGIYNCGIYSLYSWKGTVLACSRNMLQSVDGGRTWRICPWQLGESECSEGWKYIEVAGDGTLLVGNDINGLYAAGSSGSPWIEVWNYRYIQGLVCRDGKTFSPVRWDELAFFDAVTKNVTITEVIDSEYDELMDVEIDCRGRIYTGNCKSGIYRSSDGGETWSNINVVFEGNYYEGHPLDIKVKGDSVIFVSAYLDIYRSTDDGDTWEKLDQAGLSLEIGPEGTIYLCGGNGILASADNGDTWELRSSDPIAPMTYSRGAVKLSISANGHMLLSYHEIVFHSLDGGRSWYRDHSMNYHDSSNRIQDMAFGPDGHAYILGESCILRSPTDDY